MTAGAFQRMAADRFFLFFFSTTAEAVLFCQACPAVRGGMAGVFLFAAQAGRSPFFREPVARTSLQVPFLPFF